LPRYYGLYLRDKKSPVGTTYNSPEIHFREEKAGNSMMNTALMLIDIQNDYFPGGSMELDGSIEASLNAKKALSFFREKNLPIVHIQHFSVRPGSTFFLPNTDGVNIHPNVIPLADESVIEKNYPNSFRNTPLSDVLSKKQINHLVIAGMMTHMCVDATTRAAFDYGFQCTLLHDACATRTLVFEDKTIPAQHVHYAFLSALNGVYAKVTRTDAFLKGV
jgi:nicotinamidase-related amidase